MIYPLQTYVTPWCNILDMRAANSDVSRLSCPRRGEEKKEEDSKPSLSSKKSFIGEKNCVQEEARKKEKRIPSHRCRRKRFHRRKKLCTSLLKQNNCVSIFPEMKYFRYYSLLC